MVLIYFGPCCVVIVSDEVIKELTSMSKHRNIYNNLARSIAPEVSTSSLWK